MIRLNGGQERYYYSLDRASYKENYYEDLTTLNYISPKIELRRSSLDRMIFPHSGTSLSLSGIYLYGRDRFVPSPYSRDEQRLRKSKRDVSWWAPASCGTSISRFRAANGFRWVTAPRLS